MIKGLRMLAGIGQNRGQEIAVAAGQSELKRADYEGWATNNINMEFKRLADKQLADKQSADQQLADQQLAEEKMSGGLAQFTEFATKILADKAKILEDKGFDERAIRLYPNTIVELMLTTLKMNALPGANTDGNLCRHNALVAYHIQKNFSDLLKLSASEPTEQGELANNFKQSSKEIEQYLDLNNKFLKKQMSLPSLNRKSAAITANQQELASGKYARGTGWLYATVMVGVAVFCAVDLLFLGGATTSVVWAFLSSNLGEVVTPMLIGALAVLPAGLGIFTGERMRNESIEMNAQKIENAKPHRHDCKLFSPFAESTSAASAPSEAFADDLEEVDDSPRPAAA